MTCHRQFTVFSNKAAVVATAVLILSACSGGGDAGSGGDNLLQGCRPIAGGGTVTSTSVSPGCVGCDVSTAAQAIDGNGSSFATLNMPTNSAGSVTLRATAQSGVVFPAGSLAGMVHSISYGTSAGLAISLVTYAGGVRQEQFNFNSGSGSSTQNPAAPARASYTTTRQYDAVELNFTRASGAGVVEARIHEFCSN